MKNCYLNKKILLIPVIAALIAVLGSCSLKKQAVDTPITRTTFGMDTSCSITVYADKDRDAVSEAFELLKKYEKIFSRTDPESELFMLNANAGTETEVSDELYDILETCLGYCEKTGGKFDITLGGVSALYGFSDEEPVAPYAEEVEEAILHTGYEKVHLLPGNRVLVDDPELVLDLGAAAKGYAADRMADILRRNFVTSAIISLGGNVITIGSKPSGEAFSVGIATPVKYSTTPLFSISSRNNSVVTSGVYQRSYIQDGILYHHLLDSETGLPITNDWLSVSVVAESSLTADILSTSCFALGPEASEVLISGLENVRVYFIDSELKTTKIP